MKYIKMTHPDLGEAQVVPSAVPVWQDRGWSVEGEYPTQTPSASAENTEQRTAASNEGGSTAPAESN